MVKERQSKNIIFCTVRVCMLGRRMLERRIYVRTSLENEKGSCVQTHAFIGTASIQYDSKPRVMEAEGTLKTVWC